MTNLANCVAGLVAAALSKHGGYTLEPFQPGYIDADAPPEARQQADPDGAKEWHQMRLHNYLAQFGAYGFGPAMGSGMRERTLITELGKDVVAALAVVAVVNARHFCRDGAAMSRLPIPRKRSDGSRTARPVVMTRPAQRMEVPACRTATFSP